MHIVQSIISAYPFHVCYNHHRRVTLVTRNDKILVLSCVVVTIIFWARFNVLTQGPDALSAVFVIGGKEVVRLPVDIDTLSQVTVSVPRGEITIEYGQGKVRVLPLDHSVCPNEICWRTGWISRSGQSIVCVPNQLVITLEGAQPEIDFILH